MIRLPPLHTVRLSCLHIDRLPPPRNVRLPSLQLLALIIRLASLRVSRLHSVLNTLPCAGRFPLSQ